MAIQYFKSKTEATSKRHAQKKKADLKRRGYDTELVNKKEGKLTIWGVRYSCRHWMF